MCVKKKQNKKGCMYVGIGSPDKQTRQTEKRQVADIDSRRDRAEIKQLERNSKIAR
jgi:hypothetical protein